MILQNRSYFMLGVVVLQLLFSCSTKKNIQTSQADNKSVIKGEMKLSEGQQLAFESAFFDATKHQALEEYVEAIEDFEKALKSNPSSAVCYYEMSITSEKIGNLNKSLEYASMASKLNPSNKWYILQKAELLRSNGRNQEAAKAYQEYVDLDKNNFEVLVELADLYTYNRNYEAAADIYGEILKITGPNEDVILQIQRLYIQDGKTDKAVKKMESLIEQYPDDPMYYGILGQMYSDIGEDEKSVKMYEKALELKPNDGKILVGVAIYHSMKKNEKKAIEYLKRAFKTEEVNVLMQFQILNDYYEQTNYDTSYMSGIYDLLNIMEEEHPDDAKTYVIYGDYLVRSNNNKLAREKYLKAAEIDQGNYAIWSQLITIDLQERDYTALEEDTRSAKDLFPSQPIFYLYNGIALMKLKDFKKAKSVLFEGKELVIDNNKLLFDYYQNLGDLFYELQDYPNSNKYYDLALELEPNSPFLLNNYAYYLSLRKENLDRAEQMSKKANELFPNQASFLDTYGWILFEQAKYEEAQKWIEMAMEHGGDQSGVIVEHLGDILIMRGEVYKAIKTWEKAKEIGGTSDKIDEKIKEKKYIE